MDRSRRRCEDGAQLAGRDGFPRNRIDGWRILSEKSTAWAVKLDGGEIVAFAPQCTHLGCAYHWDDPKKQFLCPCHTSVFFDRRQGRLRAGAAPARPVRGQGSK
jgi:menaquinol-cytochrome c reductase iron-sulfur subunit